jgi:hypothetical protein
MSPRKFFFYKFLSVSKDLKGKVWAREEYSIDTKLNKEQIYSVSHLNGINVIA